MRLQDYEPGKDMGKDWYDWRIIHLVDEVNRLTDLLAASPSRTYDDLMEAQREKREALIEDPDRPSLVEFGLSQHPEV